MPRDGVAYQIENFPSRSPRKTALYLCFLLAILPLPMLAQAGGSILSFSSSTGAGVLFGQANEFVYNQALAADYKNSELIWPFEPLAYAGASLALGSSFGLFAALDLKQGFAGKTGTMTDSDFLNGDGQRTHFSQSDCYAERATLLDLSLGYDFSLSSALKLGVFGLFSFMDFKWSSRDGYYQYPSTGSEYTGSGNTFSPGNFPVWTAQETKTPIYGSGIFFEQAYMAGSLGLRASYRILPAFTMGASASFAPLVYCYQRDNHEFRLVDFYSRLASGLMLEPALKLEYAAWPGASLRLDVAYRWVAKLKGDLLQIEQGTSSSSSSPAGPDAISSSTMGSGASLSSLDARFSLSLNL
jgi:outer membrane protease